jgi:hypothetical protein
MALIKRRERDSHWYHRNGDPCHTVMGKTTGLPRPTTVTDAKKMNLVPSVTNILGMKAKPALDVWKLDKAILAAIQLERMGGETDEMFASRIAEASEEETRKAAEWGTLLHEQIEHYNVNKVFSGTGEILPYVAGYERWYRDNVIEVISAEQSCVSHLGYAGRLDLYAMINHEGRARRAIVDAKSQRLKGKRDGVFYLEWAMQLAPFDPSLRWMVVQQMLRDERLEEAARTVAPLAYSPHPGEHTERARQLLREIEGRIEGPAAQGEVEPAAAMPGAN